MNKRRFLLCFLLGPVLVLAQSLKSYPNDPIGLKTTTLPNGLQVYLIEDHGRPEVFGAVAVKAGGKYDPKDATGMGHYLEHMLFKGTEELGTIDFQKEKPFLDRIDSLYEELGKTEDEAARKSIQTKINENAVAAAEYAVPNELDRLISSIGGKGLNAFTTEEMIVYHNSFPPNQIEKWLDISAHRFENPVFRLFQSELETVYEEKNRAMDGFEYAIFKRFSENFYKNHPYGTQEIIGETDHLKNPSLMKMYAYYHTYYVANNMALVVLGDFDAEAILPTIQEKFGKWKTGEVPKFPEFPEDPFAGRELVVGRYTPIKAGLMGFRTCPLGHPDGAALEVVNYLLSNPKETGILEKLSFDNKVMMASLEEMRYQDHGGSLIIIVPKIVGQSFKKAEQIVLSEIQKVGKGEFTDDELQAAKLNLRLDKQKEIESPMAKGLMVVEAFIQGRDWDNYYQEWSQIEKVSRADVQAVARKYYGDNYLILQSKMGFPKKEKLEKPAYQAPKPSKDAESPYAQAFNRLPETRTQARFFDWEKDISRLELNPHLKLYHKQNEVNDLFELKFQFLGGIRQDPWLEIAAGLIWMSGTKDLSTNEFKAKMQTLGCSYNLDAMDNWLEISISGPDNHLADALALLSQLVYQPVSGEDKIDQISKMIKTDRKMEKRNVGQVARFALDYALFGQNSDPLRRVALKSVQESKVADLHRIFAAALKHTCHMHYSGTHSAEKVSQLVQQNFFQENTPSIATHVQTRERQRQTEPTVYFLPRKDAIQSHIYYFKDGVNFDWQDAWLMEAFNEYFGGMSGIVFQEIREFRSLAYSAWGRIQFPRFPQESSQLNGYIGCQGDKTSEALSVMQDLILNMPQKPERMAAVKKSLEQSAILRYPYFRDATANVQAGEWAGLKESTMPQRLQQYGNLTWEGMKGYFEEHILNQGGPLVWVVVGDPGRIPSESLAKLGKVVELKESQILRD